MDSEKQKALENSNYTPVKLPWAKQYNVPLGQIQPCKPGYYRGRRLGRRDSEFRLEFSPLSLPQFLILGQEKITPVGPGHKLYQMYKIH